MLLGQAHSSQQICSWTLNGRASGKGAALCPGIFPGGQWVANPSLHHPGGGSSNLEP